MKTQRSPRQSVRDVLEVVLIVLLIVSSSLTIASFVIEGRKFLSK